MIVSDLKKYDQRYLVIRLNGDVESPVWDYKDNEQGKSFLIESNQGFDTDLGEIVTINELLLNLPPDDTLCWEFSGEEIKGVVREDRKEGILYLN